jgi:hypothetical protein
MAFQAGDDDDWDFLEVIRLPKDSIQDLLALRVAPSGPACDLASQSPGLPVDAGESLLDLWVFDDDEFPSLSVTAGGRSDGQLYQAKDDFIVHRVRFQPADCPLRLHGLVQRHSKVHIFAHHLFQLGLLMIIPSPVAPGHAGSILQTRARTVCNPLIGSDCSGSLTPTPLLTQADLQLLS